MYQDNLPQNSSNINAHEIDYKIFGEEMQFVEIELDPEEGVVAESGTFMMMDDQIKMNTILGDGSNQEKGILGKIFSAGKRILTGESLFMTVFTNIGIGKKQISFASPYPGKIVPIDLNEFGGKFICQKDAFLCAAKGTKLDIAFNKKIGAGLFGGEGFILQDIKGDGKAFLHAGGTIIKKELNNETIRVDTGCIVAFTPSLDYSIERAGNLRSMLFGGEGLFLATIKGTGTLYLQSLPFSRLADRILYHAPSNGGSAKGEGSVLGGLGRLVDGD